MIAAKDEGSGRSFNFSITEEQFLGVQIGRADSMYRFTGTVEVEYKTWIHVAMVYDFIEDGISTITTYYNGQIDGTIADVVGPINPTATPFRVGARSYGPYPNNFNGLIDEVRIYNQALTADEIVTLMGE